MPNRIIREGWIESPRVDQLDANAERFFLRLCLRADDFGRYHALPQLLRSNLYPLRDDVRVTEISRWLALCEKAGLVTCYQAEGKPYLVVHKFDQRMRAANSKFPSPPSNDGQPSDIGQTSVSPPRTEAQTHSETETKVDAPAARPEFFPDNLNTDAFKTAWRDFVEYRKERHLPAYKPKSYDGQMKELSGWGEADAISSIRQTIRNNWQGLFPPKEGPVKNGYSPKPTPEIKEPANWQFRLNAEFPESRLAQETRPWRQIPAGDQKTISEVLK